MTGEGNGPIAALSSTSITVQTMSCTIGQGSPGTTGFKVGDSVWKMKKGDSYFIPPGVMHELKTDPAQQCVVIDFFTPERQDYRPETVAPDQG